MKFTDGNWMMQPGVRAHYAAEAYEVREDERSLTIVAPCHAIRHRGDTLSGPVLTITLASPTAGVIRVRIDHFLGAVDHGPHFELSEAPGEVTKIITDEEVVFTSGSLTARINRKNWAIDFESNGRRITGSPNRSTAYMEVEGKGPYCVDSLTMGVGECIYGLGERFTAFVKNGQTVDIWNKDGGTNSEQAYKNIPFYLTNRGYGVFVNSPSEVSYEIGTEKTNRVQFSVSGESLEYFVLDGPTPKEVL